MSIYKGKEKIAVGAKDYAPGLRAGLADDLKSPDGVTDSTFFKFRTSAGTASISSGMARVVSIKGNANHPAHAPVESLIEQKDNFSFTFNESTFISKTKDSGLYAFVYNGTNWTLSETSLSAEQLVEYGIVITPVSLQKGDTLNVVRSSSEQSGETASALPLFAKRLTVSIEDAVFTEKVGNAGSYAFSFSEGGWKYDSGSVTLVDYGITVSGSAVEGDVITVVYSESYGEAKCNPSKISGIKAVGINLFNKEDKASYLENATIDASGQIVSGEDFVVCVKVPKLSDTGIIAYTESGMVKGIGYGGTLVLEETITSFSEGKDEILADEEVASETNVFVVVSSIDDLCIHFTWSGYKNDVLAEYTANALTLPTTDAQGSPLPLDNGLARVGSVADEFAFENKKFYKRIGHKEFSSENLEEVQGLGVDFIYDDEDIFYVLSAPQVYELSAAYVAEYFVDDFGTEQVIPADGSSDPEITIFYEPSLRDKLRTDVVTLSSQELSESQKTQVRQNISVFPVYERFLGRILYPKCQSRPRTFYDSYRGIEEDWQLEVASNSTWKDLVVKASVPITVYESNGTRHIFFSESEIPVGVGNLVSGNAFEAGKAYFVYLILTTAKKWNFRISTSPTQSFSGVLASRLIGGFETVCVSVPANTVYQTIETHPFSGAEAGQIHPFSVWDIWHRPFCNPEGFAYVPTQGIWASIYLMSMDSTLSNWTVNNSPTGFKYPNDSVKLVSRNGGTILDGTSSPALGCLDGEQQLVYQGMRLPSIDEFSDMARGAPQGTNIKGSADPGKTGGHVDTNNKRIISYCGLEDIVGVMWQWSSESSWDTSSNTSGANNFNANRRDVAGQYYYGAGKRALLGGCWYSGAFCGSRGLTWNDSPLSLDFYIGFRAVAESIHK